MMMQMLCVPGMTDLQLKTVTVLFGTDGMSGSMGIGMHGVQTLMAITVSLLPPTHIRRYLL